MKTTIVTVAATTLLFSSANLFATENLKTLTDSDWVAIAQEAELDNMRAIDDMPEIWLNATIIDWALIEEQANEERLLEAPSNLVPVINKALVLDLEKGRDAVMTLKAPFKDADEVGLVILDENGYIVHRSAGTFGKLKNLRFSPLTKTTATYVVRVYSTQSVFETKLQIVNL